jgi:hypothetical protein
MAGKKGPSCIFLSFVMFHVPHCFAHVDKLNQNFKRSVNDGRNETRDAKRSYLLTNGHNLCNVILVGLSRPGK